MTDWEVDCKCWWNGWLHADIKSEACGCWVTYSEAATVTFLRRYSLTVRALWQQCRKTAAIEVTQDKCCIWKQRHDGQEWARNCFCHREQNNDNTQVSSTRCFSVNGIHKKQCLFGVVCKQHPPSNHLTWPPRCTTVRRQHNFDHTHSQPWMDSMFLQ